MIPIFEQGKSEGIGHSYESFIKRFQEICKEHLATKRAHAFAFIFYDFEDKVTREIFKSQGGFAELDRLSGKKLSVFYLNSDNPELIKSFNYAFKYAFDVDESISMPFVMFLRFDGEIEEVEDFKISILEQNNYLFAFKELYSTIEDYVKQIDDPDKEIRTNSNKLIQVFNKYKNIALEEFIKLIFQESYKKIYP